MAVNNNLYPPIVDTYMPAFLITGSNTQNDICRVYFSLSSFNILSDVKNAQVIVVHQNTNGTVLDTDIYPSEVMIKMIQQDPLRTTDDKYYIEILNSDLKNGFEINQYYKVQIRFTSTNASDYTPSNGVWSLDSWLSANLSFFSEWSTVCLIRGISVPTLEIMGFDPNSTTYWSRSSVEIIGKLTFADSKESETLKSYVVKLSKEDGTLLSESETLYTSNFNDINSFNYVFNYGLIEGENYILTIDYITQNLYKDSVNFRFIVIENYIDRLEADINYVIDEENARIGINLTALEGAGPFVGNITIRRTSSKSNFTIWEDVHTVSIEPAQILNYTWYDYTIESGVWYRYCAQKRSNRGQRGLIIELKHPRMLTFDDMYITGNNCQLKVRFNPTVSSFKRNVSESNTVTIGSKYPFIKRNGYTYYRSFPIGGLISSAMDEDNIFTSKDEIYGSEDNIKLYDDYNEEHKIPIEYDFTYEREFREKVEDFLMENKVKLFRSPTEGNILVKLTDVNFTPNQTLGRRLYSFTATAYEIDDFTLENCNKYGIQFLGEYNVHTSYLNSYIGQIQDTIPANTDVIEIIRQKYEQYAQPEHKIMVKNLDYLHIEMEGNPYLIYEGGTGPYPAETGINTFSTDTLDKAFLGYIVYINSVPIVINAEGRYELSNEGTEITSLSFPVNTKLNLEYNVNIDQVADEISVIQTTNIIPTIGQLWGSFTYKDSLYKKLWNKYYEKYTDYSQSMYYLNSIQVEADPGTVVYIKENEDTDFEKHIIGKTCLLNFYNNTDTNITGLYFTGIHFEEATDYEKERDTLPNFKFKETGITLDEFMLMRDYKLIKNGIYNLTPGFIEKYPQKMANTESIANRSIQSPKKALIDKLDTDFVTFIENKIANAEGRYIWYNEKFWLFTEDNDLLCPVEALIDYTCDIAKERYEQ